MNLGFLFVSGIRFSLLTAEILEAVGGIFLDILDFFKILTQDFSLVFVKSGIIFDIIKVVWNIKKTKIQGL